MTFEQMLIDWTPTWVILSILIIGFIAYYRFRVNYKKAQLTQQKTDQKKNETFEGAIGGMLRDAPKNLTQVESEIASIEAQGKKDGVPKEQIEKLTQRLNSEKDMLTYAVKYGDMAKPLLKPVGLIINKILGSIGGT